MSHFDDNHHQPTNTHTHHHTPTRDFYHPDRTTHDKPITTQPNSFSVQLPQLPQGPAASHRHHHHDDLTFRCKGSHSTPNSSNRQAASHNTDSRLCLQPLMLLLLPRHRRRRR
jgi:hypothetical protein